MSQRSHSDMEIGGAGQKLEVIRTPLREEVVSITDILPERTKLEKAYEHILEHLEMEEYLSPDFDPTSLSLTAPESK